MMHTRGDGVLIVEHAGSFKLNGCWGTERDLVLSMFLDLEDAGLYPDRALMSIGLFRQYREAAFRRGGYGTQPTAWRLYGIPVFRSVEESDWVLKFYRDGRICGIITGFVA